MKDQPTEPPSAASTATAEDGAEAGLSRRRLLRMAALGLGAVAVGGVLEACKSQTVPLPNATDPGTAFPTQAGASPEDSLSPEPVESFEDTPDATDDASSGPTASGAYPDLVVVKKGEPEALVRRAIEALGGMERFVSKGASVIVKPNVCVAYRTYEYAATTNPWVVGALVKMAFEAGAASVKVLDYPYGGAAAAAYTKSGIEPQVTAAGGQMIAMSSRRYVSTRIPKGKWLKQADVYDEVLKADVLINVPIAKRHGSAVMTAAMKNLMGVVRDRPTMHGNLAQAIADLCTVIQPELTVVDAVRILTAHGPSGGRLGDVRKLDIVIAGTDMVAADAYTAGLFGLKVRDVPYVGIGASMKLGRSDLTKLKIEEITI